MGPRQLFAKVVSFVPAWLLPRAAILIVLAGLIYSGLLDPIERLLSDWRFELAARPASQTLTVVEIDTASLRALDTWPWPRGYYAQAIENLRRAGARNVGMDIDFSGRADPAEDAKLAQAITAANGAIILPAFMQPARQSNGSITLTEILPNQRLRQGALLASVNLIPETDGVLRKGYLVLDTGDGLRPSMAAALHGAALPDTSAYYIDFGIELPSITRLSFADVLSNNFDPKLVAGRNILVGATALELGDEFAVPVHGIASGVYLHALSYESIVQHRTLVRPSLIFTLLLALIVVALLCRDRKQWSWVSVLAPHSAVLALAFGGPLATQIIAPVSMDASPILAAQLLCLMRTVGLELERRAREIFQQRALAARQHALVALAVKDSTDGIIVTDAEGRIELCNERAATLLKLPNLTAAVGKDLTALIPDFPTYPTELAPGSSSRVPSDCFPVIQDFAHGDQIVEVSSDWTLCEDKSVKDVAGGHIYVHTLRDISARKRMEEAERQLKESLIAASNTKSQFIHAMSHELRTPLNAIIGFSEMMTRQAAGPLNNPKYVEFVKLIHDGGKHLLSVVNDVLDVTRLESGDVKVDKESVALRSFVERTIERRDDGEVKQVDIAVPDDMRILVDRKIFGQTLQHLLSNAWKFTRDDGRIEIDARVDNGDDVVVEVRDNGVGVAPEELPKLAQAFFQGDPTLSRKHGGTGLGLFLVTKYLALHGGTLELESEPGRGFLARIRLPGALAPPAAKPLQAVA